jgi:hypothetical protein
MIVNGIYPLVICDIAVENGPVEIVDVPIKHADFPYIM